MVVSAVNIDLNLPSNLDRRVGSALNDVIMAFKTHFYNREAERLNVFSENDTETGSISILCSPEQSGYGKNKTDVSTFFESVLSTYKSSLENFKSKLESSKHLRLEADSLQAAKQTDLAILFNYAYSVDVLRAIRKNTEYNKRLVMKNKQNLRTFSKDQINKTPFIQLYIELINDLKKNNNSSYGEIKDCLAAYDFEIFEIIRNTLKSLGDGSTMKDYLKMFLNDSQTSMHNFFVSGGGDREIKFDGEKFELWKAGEESEILKTFDDSIGSVLEKFCAYSVAFQRNNKTIPPTLLKLKLPMFKRVNRNKYNNAITSKKNLNFWMGLNVGCGGRTDDDDDEEGGGNSCLTCHNDMNTGEGSGVGGTAVEYIRRISLGGGADCLYCNKNNVNKSLTTKFVSPSTLSNDRIKRGVSKVKHNKWTSGMLIGRGGDGGNGGLQGFVNSKNKTSDENLRQMLTHYHNQINCSNNFDDLVRIGNKFVEMTARLLFEFESIDKQDFTRSLNSLDMVLYHAINADKTNVLFTTFKDIVSSQRLSWYLLRNPVEIQLYSPLTEALNEAYKIFDQELTQLAASKTPVRFEPSTNNATIAYITQTIESTIEKYLVNMSPLLEKSLSGLPLTFTFVYNSKTVDFNQQTSWKLFENNTVLYLPENNGFEDDKNFRNQIRVALKQNTLTLNDFNMLNRRIENKSRFYDELLKVIGRDLFTRYIMSDDLTIEDSPEFPVIVKKGIIQSLNGQASLDLACLFLRGVLKEKDGKSADVDQAITFNAGSAMPLYYFWMDTNSLDFIDILNPQHKQLLKSVIMSMGSMYDVCKSIFKYSDTDTESDADFLARQGFKFYRNNNVFKTAETYYSTNVNFPAAFVVRGVRLNALLSLDLIKKKILKMNLKKMTNPPPSMEEMIERVIIEDMINEFKLADMEKLANTIGAIVNNQLQYKLNITVPRAKTQTGGVVLSEAPSPMDIMYATFFDHFLKKPRVNSSLVVAGPSGTGKTFFIYNNKKSNLSQIYLDLLKNTDDESIMLYDYYALCLPFASSFEKCIANPLFVQWGLNAEGEGRRLTGKLTNQLEDICLNKTAFFSNNITSPADNYKTVYDNFYAAVDAARKDLGYLQKTPNNPESSRSLFYFNVVFKKQENTTKNIIDLPGTEMDLPDNNPINKFLLFNFNEYSRVDEIGPRFNFVNNYTPVKFDSVFLNDNRMSGSSIGEETLMNMFLNFNDWSDFLSTEIYHKSFSTSLPADELLRRFGVNKKITVQDLFFTTMLVNYTPYTFKFDERFSDDFVNSRMKKSTTLMEFVNNYIEFIEGPKTGKKKLKETSRVRDILGNGLDCSRQDSKINNSQTMDKREGLIFYMGPIWKFEFMRNSIMDTFSLDGKYQTQYSGGYNYIQYPKDIKFGLLIDPIKYKSLFVSFALLYIVEKLSKEIKTLNISYAEIINTYLKLVSSTMYKGEDEIKANFIKHKQYMESIFINNINNLLVKRESQRKTVNIDITIDNLSNMFYDMICMIRDFDVDSNACEKNKYAVPAAPYFICFDFMKAAGQSVFFYKNNPDEYVRIDQIFNYPYSMNTCFSTMSTSLLNSSSNLSFKRDASSKGTSSILYNLNNLNVILLASQSNVESLTIPYLNLISDGGLQASSQSFVGQTTDLKTLSEPNNFKTFLNKLKDSITEDLRNNTNNNNTDNNISNNVDAAEDLMVFE